MLCMYKQKDDGSLLPGSRQHENMHYLKRRSSRGPNTFLTNKGILFKPTASNFRGSSLKIVLWNILCNTLNIIDTFLKIGQFIHKITSFYVVQFGMNLAPNWKLLRLCVISHCLEQWLKHILVLSITISWENLRILSYLLLRIFLWLYFLIMFFSELSGSWRS